MRKILALFLRVKSGTRDSLLMNITVSFFYLHIKTHYWSQGIQRNFLLEEWHGVLHIIQIYVKCEGRFTTIYRYHMHFLQQVSGTKKLNLPYYLLKSLGKMAIRVRNHPDSSRNIIFHHGMIKLLIAQDLEKYERSWSHFLFWSGFKVEFKEGKEGKRK